jgi:predicted Rossmann-fold nucleotide-binding protein
MGRIGPCVSILVQHEQTRRSYYLLAEKIAYKISKAGYGVYRRRPGIMEAGNKGRIWAVELQWD